MHVAHIGFFNDPHDRQPEQLLQDWPTLGAVAECVQQAGVRVSVIQACRHSQHITRRGVGYHFLPFGGGRLAGIEHPFAALLRHLAPEVFHVHGLDFAPDVISLAAVAPQVPIVLQDHASRPPRPWRRSLWRKGCSRASAIAFCSLDQARPFKRLDLIPAATRIYAIPESSSHFTPGDRDQARCQSRVTGDPALLWVGHLDTNKDPLTVLEGVSGAVRALPSLSMYCCYGTSPLLPEVQRRIAADPNLRERVHLLGAVPHAEIERLMRAADIFVLGSHREGSGYALIEALACGLTPVVTDIPSFRELTGSGRIGALWPPDDAGRLSECLQSVAAQFLGRRRAEVRSYFESELSFDVVGRKLASAYEDVLSETHARLR